MRVGFFLKEAFRSLKRNAAPSTAAVLTVLMTALVLGVFIPIVQATTGTANSIRGKVVVDIYAKDSASLAQLHELRDALATTPNVKKIQFITKQQALADERKKHPEAYALLGDNPLPNLFRVTPRDPDKIAAIIDRLEPLNPKTGKREPQLAGIDEVRNRAPPGASNPEGGEARAAARGDRRGAKPPRRNQQDPLRDGTREAAHRRSDRAAHTHLDRARLEHDPAVDLLAAARGRGDEA